MAEKKGEFNGIPVEEAVVQHKHKKTPAEAGVLKLLMRKIIFLLTVSQLR